MFLGSGPAFPLQTVFSLTSLGTVKQMEPTFTMHQCLCSQTARLSADAATAEP